MNDFHCSGKGLFSSPKHCLAKNLQFQMMSLTKFWNCRPYLNNQCHVCTPGISFNSYASLYGSWNVYREHHELRACKTHKPGLRIRMLQRPIRAMPSKAIANSSTWEDPYVYDSEEEEDDREKPGSNDEEKLMKEVELMLNPEERAILQKNESPDFSKLISPKWVPLHTLATSGQIRFLDDALKHGFDVNSVDKYGLTALQKVLLCKKEAVFSRLLKRGADPHVRDKDGATLLHYAVLVGAIQTLKLLIKHNVDVNLADNEGWTPLHLAVQSRMRDVARVLLLSGADKTIKNKDGNTPFDVAISLGKGFKTYEITKLLKLVPATDV